MCFKAPRTYTRSLLLTVGAGSLLLSILPPLPRDVVCACCGEECRRGPRGEKWGLGGRGGGADLAHARARLPYSRRSPVAPRLGAGGCPRSALVLGLRRSLSCKGSHLTRGKKGSRATAAVLTARLRDSSIAIHNSIGETDLSLMCGDLPSPSRVTLLTILQLYRIQRGR